MANFEWYRSFISIYKLSSVSEAAKARIMTQPAMSQHLASLEAEVGEPLFIRTPRKMVPTERGKELYTQLAPMIESLEEMTLGFRAASTPALPVIKIGSAPEFFRERIAPRLGSLNMRVIAYFGSASSIVELVTEDKVDLIVTSQKIPAAGVEFIPYFEEEFVVVAPSAYDHPEFDNKEQLEAWLSAQPWISYGLELPIIRRFWREIFQKRPQLKPAHVLPDLHAILASVEQGAGISILPAYMLDSALQEGQIKRIAQPYQVSNELFLAYQIKNRSMPHIKRVIEALKEETSIVS